MPKSHSGWIGAALTAASLATLVNSPGAHAATPYQRYVALGDSAAAVGSLDKLKPGSPAYCARAEDNYPSDLARRLGVAQFVDVTCASATTANMTEPQTGRLGEPSPPQFDALTADTDLVTITIGANDIGGDTINTVSPEQLDTVRRNVGAVLDSIHQRAPRATVVVTSYLRYLPPGGGCDGLTDQGGMQRLTDTLRDIAGQHGARFADAQRQTGHDLCQPPGTNWVNGPIPNTLSVPLHANAAGQAHIAAVVADVLDD